MKATLFTPYLDTIGGGERYMLSIARALLEEGWNVQIEASDESLIPKAEETFGFSLKGLQVVPSIRRGEGSDLCVWLSDGSIPTLHARRNILHFQRPFQDVDGRSLVSRMKLFRVSKVIVNSAYTKRYIDAEYPVKSTILYPPVDVSKFKPRLKDKLILYVGRFSQLEQAKRQDILLKAFIKLYRFHARDWKLVLAGGSRVGRTEEVDILRQHAKNHPIELLENPPFKEVKSLFEKSSIFWSAAGYGTAENEPERREHFGMTVVEAMASGAVPIIFNGGGHPEIVQNGVNGFLWDTPTEMLYCTKKLIADPKMQEELKKNAIETSQVFSYESFKAQFLTLL